MKRVIITGASGFVGANLARRLLKEGHDVNLLVRPDYNKWRIDEIRKDVRLHMTHLEVKESVEHIVNSIRPDWIFHLAAHGAYSSQTNLNKIVETNLLGTINLIQASLKSGFEAFINTGSSSEYGFKDHASTEEERLDPNSYYAVTKASSTLFCRYTAQSKGLYLPTLRLYSVYGPFEEPTRLMPTIISSGLRGKLPLLVNPDIARDFVYTEDVIDAYLLAATSTNQDKGAIYNVGTGTQTTLSDVVNVAQSVLNVKDKPEWGTMQDRNWDTSVWLSDNKKIQDELGWQPRYTFEQGFRKMVNWLRDNHEMQTFYYRQLKKDK